MNRLRVVLPWIVLVTVLVAGIRPAPACRLVELGFRPAASDLQVVIWIEDASGRFIQTAFVTDKTGRYGLGNRPGRFDFNSEWHWPYGRRTTTFPVWAGRSPKTYPKLVFQDGDDDDLSHAINDSSVEPYYCRPLHESEADAMSCASVAYTDKGMFHATETSKYPPRNDMTFFMEGVDHPDVASMEGVNDLDAISQPTPPGDADKNVFTILSNDLPDGEYVAFIEVSREFDQNATFDYPSPEGIPWSEYGRPYRGQPSLLWTIPFASNATGGQFGTLEYAGSGDPAGADEGVVFAVDAYPAGAITTEPTRPILNTPGDGVSSTTRRWTFAAGAFSAADLGRTLTVSGAGNAALNATFTIETVAGPSAITTVEAPAVDESFGAGVQAEVCCQTASGALRLMPISSSGGAYRFQLEVTNIDDAIPPDPVTDVTLASVTPEAATIEFTAPADEGASGKVIEYEIRTRAGSPLTEENFLSLGIPIPSTLAPQAPGTRQTITMTGLQPETHYWVGIRGADECLNRAQLVIFELVTPAEQSPEVGCGCRAGSRAGGPAFPIAGAFALAGAVAFLCRLFRRRRTS